MEVAPHYRRPHMALVWTGAGRAVPKVVPRRGSVVHREKVEKVKFSVDDWDYLAGEIYFEAEEADNPERRKRLNGIYSRIEELLAAYRTHE